MGKQSRTTSVSDLHPNLSKMVTQNISADEVILLCLETKYDYGYPSLSDLIGRTLTLRGSDHGTHAAIITSKRVLRANRDYRSWSRQYSESVTSLMLNEVITIQEKQEKYSHGMSYAVITRGHGEAVIHFEFESMDVASSFAESLRQMRNDVAKPLSKSTLPNSGSISERLRELARLHDEGLISDYEFQNKRSEILRGI